MLLTSKTTRFNSLIALLAILSPITLLRAANPPVVLKTIDNVNVPRGGATTTVNLAGRFGLANITGPLSGTPGPIARFSLALGIIDIEMFPDVTPVTVANFRKYITDKDYDATFIHRAVPNFVIQGGGYKITSATTHIPTDAPIKNEFQRSNLTGTIAMAKLGGNINSATSEWFFNVVDNTFLDDPGQQFAVFGRIIGNGLSKAISITQLPIVNLGGALSELPLVNYAGGDVYTTNLVALNTLREIPFIPTSATSGGYLTLSATSSNTTLVAPSIVGGTLTLKSVGSGTGSATITVKALDVYAQAVTTTFTVNVVNTALPKVTISVADSSASEPGTNTGTFYFTRTGAATSPLTVAITSSGSTAINGTDFNTLPATVVFAAGVTVADVLLTPKTDTLKEGTEKVKVSVSAGSSYYSAPINNVTIPLIDDDVPTVTISALDASATEGTTTDTAKFRFTRTGLTTTTLAATALTVPYTLSGSAIFNGDYTISSFPAVIPVGATFVDVTVTAKDDSGKEGLETVTATLNTSTAANIKDTPVSVRIFDNELPTVTLSVADSTASEAGTDVAKAKVTRTGSTTYPLTVYLVTAGTASKGVDYLTPAAFVTIPAGQTFGFLTITPINDTTIESDEFVTVTLASSTYFNAAAGTISLTIKSDE